jgi:hypothetical protein
VQRNILQKNTRKYLRDDNPARWNHLIQIRQVTDLAILLGVSIQKMGKMQGLARKHVLQYKGLREKFYNAKAGEKISSQCKGWRENKFTMKGWRENKFTMQRLARKSVLQCTGWREIKFHNAKADKKKKFYHEHAASFIAEPSTTAFSLPSPDTSSEIWCPGQR